MSSRFAQWQAKQFIQLEKAPLRVGLFLWMLFGLSQSAPRLARTDLRP
jgi:hypothetical protein